MKINIAALHGAKLPKIVAGAKVIFRPFIGFRSFLELFGNRFNDRLDFRCGDFHVRSGGREMADRRRWTGPAVAASKLTANGVANLTASKLSGRR